jgi:hypothetical protein
MNFIRRYGQQLAVAFTAAGALLIILSFLLTSPAVYAHIWLDGGSDPFLVRVDSPFVANWLLRAGIRLYPYDSVRISGVPIPHDFAMAEGGSRQVLYKPAVPINLLVDDQIYSFLSGADTLGEALWEQGIILKQADRLQPDHNTVLDRPLNVTLRRSQPITVMVSGTKYEVLSAERMVGRALADAGFPLQNLDYSDPAADTPIPADRVIRVVRVQEEVITEETSLPFSAERVSDPNLDVGQEQVLQAGRNGTQTSTFRVRYEDGQEVDRTVLSEWVSQAPLTERVAYGGNIVEQSIGDLDYYYALDVRVTCYGWTGNTTSHGEWPAYGTIAVSLPWYSILKESQIFIPNYGTGTVLDVCPGCAGQNWIDVYTEDCYSNPFTINTTAYFLSPAPPAFTGELP